MKIHHVGIVVENIELSLNMYEELGYRKITEIIEDCIQNNKLIFLRSEDNIQVIELIQPMNEHSTVYNGKNRGYHHICYVVEEMEKELIQFKRKKIGTIFTGRIQAPAFNNNNIVFAYLKNGTIIEFLEKGDENEFI